MKYLITDIGSTTTKSYLCEEDGTVLGIAKSPTTVEKPFEDVSIGFLNAIDILQKEFGFKILEDGHFTKDINIFFTSSAGGGLQATVVGLTDIYSAKIQVNALFINEIEDIETFKDDKYKIGIAYNLHYKYFVELEKLKKTIILVNDFKDFEKTDE